ncbi:MBL fold metallo-hydrolase [Sorangium cellulosum]|uniref:MBL fold metallo-hydrolase n=1 Tax=Sorangium cellulosum TaxID=56 RepID=A0A2L0F0S2_SORCE|nr:MBL fold metallo-hydrolase [Sorangium cellulosum]AUX45126.1 MBL fold metallo-hydrolase [Sorangium cellulosum]
MTDSPRDTRVAEVADGVYQIHTPIGTGKAAFSFNQYLVVDEAPLLFHTGPRSLFPAVRAAITRVMPVERLRYVAFSHCEADECGSMNALLDAAPQAEPVCGRVAAMVDADLFDRAPRALADGEVLALGQRRVRWLDAPHLPHGWECGYLFEESTGTLLCGDLLTQPGADHPALTRNDILGPSEAMRRAMDYYAHGRDAPQLLEKLAATSPRVLACMHGSAYEGDGAALLRALSRALAGER